MYPSACWNQYLQGQDRDVWGRQVRRRQHQLKRFSNHWPNVRVRPECHLFVLATLESEYPCTVLVYENYIAGVSSSHVFSHINKQIISVHSTTPRIVSNTIDDV